MVHVHMRQNTVECTQIVSQFYRYDPSVQRLHVGPSQLPSCVGSELCDKPS